MKELIRTIGIILDLLFLLIRDQFRGSRYLQLNVVVLSSLIFTLNILAFFYLFPAYEFYSFTSLITLIIITSIVQVYYSKLVGFFEITEKEVFEHEGFKAIVKFGWTVDLIIVFIVHFLNN